MLQYKHITEQVPLFTGAMSVLPYNSSLEANYSFKSKFEDEDVQMSFRKGNMLYVPRETCPEAPKDYDYRVSYPPIAIDCNFVPRNEEQEVLIAKSLALLQQGRNHIFNAPTGWGKTIAGTVIACRLGQPTLVIVTKQDLMDQWYKSAKILGVDMSLVGKIQQDTCDWMGRRIVIGMVHSLVIPERYAEEMYKYFGLVILDEVHQMAAETFSRACYLFPARYRLGFSATPTRTDGKTKILHAHIGQVLVEGTTVPMKAKVLTVKTGWKIPIRKNYKTGELEELKYAPGRMMPIYKEMGKSIQRNQVITNFVVQSYKAGRKTLVLSDMIDGHLHPLFKCFCAAGVAGDDIAYYIGGLKEHEYQYAHKRPIILGTYAMCSTGTDVPVWDTVVFATPRARIKQPFGRILRVLDGKRQPVALDLIDYNSIFNSFHLSRLKEYYELGAEVVQMG
jgi:superfamily II DNA or RNA helicase